LYALDKRYRIDLINGSKEFRFNGTEWNLSSVPITVKELFNTIKLLWLQKKTASLKKTSQRGNLSTPSPNQVIIKEITFFIQMLVAFCSVVQGNHYLPFLLQKERNYFSQFGIFIPTDTYLLYSLTKEYMMGTKYNTHQPSHHLSFVCSVPWNHRDKEGDGGRWRWRTLYANDHAWLYFTTNNLLILILTLAL
jgi:hypothetical protein